MTDTTLTVKIVKCGQPTWWYANSVGYDFEVVAYSKQEYVVKDDYDAGHLNIWRHIGKDDCEVISTHQ